MAEVRLEVRSPLDLEATMRELLLAVEEVGSYELEQSQAEMGWGKWTSRVAPRSWLEVQVSVEGTGTRVGLSLRNSDLRDRIGLLQREAKRVARRMRQRVACAATGEAPPDQIPLRITDRMVIVGLLLFVLLLSCGGSFYQMLFAV